PGSREIADITHRVIRDGIPSELVCTTIRGGDHDRITGAQVGGGNQRAVVASAPAERPALARSIVGIFATVTAHAFHIRYFRRRERGEPRTGRAKRDRQRLQRAWRQHRDDRDDRVGILYCRVDVRAPDDLYVGQLRFWSVEKNGNVGIGRRNWTGLDP